MPSISDTKDLLYIAISISVLVFTIFFCWALYYLARILQQMFRTVKEMRRRLNMFDELVKLIKEKIEHSASCLTLIGAGVKRLVEMIKAGAEKKKRNKKEE